MTVTATGPPPLTPGYSSPLKKRPASQHRPQRSTPSFPAEPSSSPSADCGICRPMPWTTSWPRFRLRATLLEPLQASASDHDRRRLDGDERLRR